MLATADARVTLVAQAPCAAAGAAPAQTASTTPSRVRTPLRTPPFSAAGIPNLRGSVPRSSDADPPQFRHAPADEHSVAPDRAFTSGGHDRLAERSVVIAIVALLAIVTGISIWELHAT